LAHNLAVDLEAKDDRCLRDLRLTDPRGDKVRIEKSKDGLLKDSYVWILADPAFIDWRDNDNTHLLWIKGEPGKGKTMLMIGLTEELSRQLESKPGSGILSYFFCQANKPELNNAVSVLRGLIYLLAAQQRTLIKHLRKRYDTAGSRFFEDSNAFSALSTILSNMLHDPSLAKVYLMVDALDECASDLSDLLDLITCNSEPSRVKWLVSSRNWPEIEEQLRPNDFRSTIDLELNQFHISQAVNAFINVKVQELSKKKRYASELQKGVMDYLREKAKGTFLWVALVCKSLQNVKFNFKVLAALEEFPPELEPLYERMMEQIQHGEDAEDVEFCMRVLSSVTLTYRPIHLKELVATTSLPEELSNDLQSLNKLVDLCGSFLTVREEMIDFVHQSAKDYFMTGKGSKIFPSGQEEEHHKIACRSLRLMSDTLKSDICGLRMPGALLDELSDVNQDPLAHIQYACCYWVDHLNQARGLHLQTSLLDGGIVHEFLQKHLLHWLEVLSLMKHMSDGVIMLRTLESMLTVSGSIKFCHTLQI
jgi:hypothetical protein